MNLTQAYEMWPVGKLVHLRPSYGRWGKKDEALRKMLDMSIMLIELNVNTLDFL